MQVKEIKYNLPQAEYKYDGGGRLISKTNTGLSGQATATELRADDGKQLRRIATGEILGERVMLSDGEVPEDFEEVVT